MLEEVRATAHGTGRLLPALTVPVDAAVGLVLASSFGTSGIEVPAGALVTPWVAGFAATCGLAELLVRVVPAVGLLVADNAGWQPGAEAGAAGQGPLGTVLPGLVRACGGEPGPVSWLPDDAMALGIAVDLVASDSAACDVLVVVRPVTAVDSLREALASIGAEVSVDGPALLAVLPGGRLVVGLGATPVEVAIGVALVLLPVLSGLAGAPLPAARSGIVAVAVPGGDDARLVPGVSGAEGWQPVSATTEWELVVAQALLVVPTSGLAVGDSVSLIEFPGVSRR